MAVSFDHGTGVLDLVRRTRDLVSEVVIPAEREFNGSGHDLAEDTRLRLQQAARDAGVFAPHVSLEYGGFGLDMRSRAAVFEAAGYSLFGPLALNCAAPDEGNMHLLERIADDDQKERYLRPLAAGEVTSCFAMTEPAPGAGSDPRALSTTARRVGHEWIINGHKWFTTGADRAAFAIVMARTSGEPGSPGGATMFLIATDAPGFTVERSIETLDTSMFGGHSQVRLTDVRVGDGAVLGEVDAGFEAAQIRLDPARLTHCMRWLGAARRAADIALNHASSRQAFGHPLGDLGMAQALIADNEIDIEASRALLLRACSSLDTEQPSGQICSITKTFVSEAVNRVVDRAVQVCGALGISGDTALSQLYREIRPFRIYDGPSETHRWVIAKRAIRMSRDEWRSHCGRLERVSRGGV